MPRTVFVKIYQSKGNSDTMAVVIPKEVVITDAIKFVQQKKEELSKVTSDVAPNQESATGKDKENIEKSDNSPSNKVF